MAFGDNMILYVASYDDDAMATSDYGALKEAEKSGDVVLLESVVIRRDDDGEVTVDEHGTGQVGMGATGGGLVGLAVGLFAPPLLLATAFGAGIGAGIGALMKRHQESELSVELEEYLPPGTSAIVAVMENAYLDRVDHALAKSIKKIDKAIDKDDADQLKQELDDAAERIGKAIDS